jgi:hypothetical protein
MEIESLVEKEIVDLHEFFEGWFSGRLTGNEISVLDDVIHDDFMLITPHADQINKSNLIEIINSNHGKTIDQKIWVENIQIRSTYNGVILATYTECQMKNEVETCRISSALFKKDDIARNKIKWIHLHETFIETKLA